jgi:membrane-associated phospholipid phosphatase
MAPRRPHRMLRFVAGAALFGVSLAEARRAAVPEYEADAFRLANDASDAIRVPVRAVMQAGTLVTVPAAATVAWFANRRRLAASLAVGGSSAWLLTKVAKRIGGRARPSAVLTDVKVREHIGGDLGWPSGHTAVATTLALTLGPEVPAALRPVLAGIVGAVGFGRMYVGAHLPIDIVGGAGLGLMISSVMPPVGA